MKIAVIHWGTSSVGGINTTLENYRAVADERGDTFHVLACDNQRTKRPEVLAERKRVRGGDSFIWIDGYAPHHDSNYKASVELLATYDVVMTSFLCPHPTKAYGEVPVFMPLLEALAKRGVPLIGYIHDAYWDTYADWGRLVAPLCKKIVVCQKAYAEPITKLGVPTLVAYPPFYPFPLKVRSVKHNPKKVLWIPQWKNIKGIRKFMDGVLKLDQLGYAIDLYNNGIEYYKMRLEPWWPLTLNRDYFADTTGDITSKVNFFGCVTLPEVYTAVSGAGFVCDFQGHSAKHKAYLNGSYNHTLAETLYYGAVPVVHSNALKSGVPAELVLAVDDLKTYPEAIAGYPYKKYSKDRAKEYVLDNFSAHALYKKIFGGRK